MSGYGYGYGQPNSQYGWGGAPPPGPPPPNSNQYGYQHVCLTYAITLGQLLNCISSHLRNNNTMTATVAMANLTVLRPHLQHSNSSAMAPPKATHSSTPIARAAER